MSPAQLVLRGPERRTAALDLVENERGVPPLAFEDADAGVRVPRIGGAALLRAAARALEIGFTVVRIEFDGQGQLTLRDAGETDEASDSVIRVLETLGAADAEGFLDHVYERYIVSGIQVYSSATRSITLRRDGVIVGRDTRSLWIFIHQVLETSET